MAAETIRVGVAGVGAMGAAIARRLWRLPEFEVVFVIDRDGARARRVGAEVGAAVEARWADVDVLVEATSSVQGALAHCVTAIEHGADVVLMNAEVDLAFGHQLRELAGSSGALVSTDAGDQHGVLMRFAEDLRLWGVRPILYGNIKGFLDRAATPESVAPEARKRNLSPGQCCAYTDGSKLNVEMALTGNALGAAPARPGMMGLECEHVSDVLAHLDERTSVPDPDHPEVDYVLGAEPGGGVYVVGLPEDPGEAELLTYYKVRSSNGRYLFHRPFHLCHLETPGAILRVARDRRPLPDGPMARHLDVFAYAKAPLAAGTRIASSIGSEHVYGLVRTAADGDADNAVPQCLLEALIEHEGALELRRDVAAGDQIRFGDLATAFADAQTLANHLLDATFQVAHA